VGPRSGAGSGGGAVRRRTGWGDRRCGGGGGTARGGGAAAARDGGPPAGVHGPLARRDGGAGAGARRAAGVRGDPARRPRAAARVARLPRGAFAAALCGDGIPEMIQGPDIGAAVEAIVLFVRNDVAIANIGHDGAKFAPYILTLFFFILYCNLLGLLPWGAAPTGNLAVTGALALTSFLTVEISGFRALGPKGYLKTIVFVPPGMTGIGAVAMALIMTPIEIIGKIVKPFALTLRLFANMTAGHFV